MDREKVDMEQLMESKMEGLQKKIVQAILSHIKKEGIPKVIIWSKELIKKRKLWTKTS